MRRGTSQPPRSPAAGKGTARLARAFTLIELLVVIAIMGLLIGILIPALAAARQSAKLAVCRAQLSQLGLAILVYADQHGEFIPRGPACTGPVDFACADVATNQLWIGAGNESHPSQPIGMGALVENYTQNKKIYFCPGDDSDNLEEELPKIGSELDAYGSYTYRQLDQLPADGRHGMISMLGMNVVGDVKVPVEALALDTNSLGPGPLRHTNHGAKKANVLYRDRSVQMFSNREDVFSILPESYQSFGQIFARLDQILVNADYGYRHDPGKAPQIIESSGAGPRAGRSPAYDHAPHHACEITNYKLQITNYELRKRLLRRATFRNS